MQSEKIVKQMSILLPYIITSHKKKFKQPSRKTTQQVQYQGQQLPLSQNIKHDKSLPKKLNYSVVVTHNARISEIINFNHFNFKYLLKKTYINQVGHKFLRFHFKESPLIKSSRRYRLMHQHLPIVLKRLQTTANRNFSLFIYVHSLQLTIEHDLTAISSIFTMAAVAQGGH